MNTNQMASCKDLAIPGVFAIDDTGELIKASITTKLCTAEFYLQGAHLTHWQPHNHKPVLFLSDRSAFAPGKAIRGGVPIIFPWFGARTATSQSNRTDGPAHGFARTADWQLLSATMTDELLTVKLTLVANETSRALGFEHFQLLYTITFGRELSLELTVENSSQTPLCFAEAFHTYLFVQDAAQVKLEGLKGCYYYDKTDGFQRKLQEQSELQLSGETDRPYVDTAAAINLHDPRLNRRITVSKTNSSTTVIWNPWAELTGKMADMSADSWKQMVCVETANAFENSITLAPGEKHTMSACISVE